MTKAILKTVVLFLIATLSQTSTEAQVYKVTDVFDPLAAEFVKTDVKLYLKDSLLMMITYSKKGGVRDSTIFYEKVVEKDENHIKTKTGGKSAEYLIRTAEKKKEKNAGILYIEMNMYDSNGKKEAFTFLMKAIKLKEGEW